MNPPLLSRTLHPVTQSHLDKPAHLRSPGSAPILIVSILLASTMYITPQQHHARTRRRPTWRRREQAAEHGDRRDTASGWSRADLVSLNPPNDGDRRSAPASPTPEQHERGSGSGIRCHRPPEPARTGRSPAPNAEVSPHVPAAVPPVQKQVAPIAWSTSGCSVVLEMPAQGSWPARDRGVQHEGPGIWRKQGRSNVCVVIRSR